MRLLCTFLFIVSGTIVFGQQESIFNQFWNNTTHYSPAFAGLEYQHQGGALYHNQWSPINDAPRDFYGFYNTRIGGSGISVNVASGSIGSQNTYSASIPFSYHLTVNRSRNGKIGLGMALGILHQTADAEDFIYPQTPEDPAIENINEQDLQAHFGIAYKSNFVTAGFGMRNFTVASFGATDVIQYQPHYYGLLSLSSPVGSRSYSNNSKIALEGLYGYHNGFQSLQLDLRITHKDKLSVFGGYVWNQGVLLGGGWDFFGKFRSMYSLTWLKSKLNGGARFTHEISLVYQLPLTD